MFLSLFVKPSVNNTKRTMSQIFDFDNSLLRISRMDINSIKKKLWCCTVVMSYFGVLQFFCFTFGDCNGVLFYFWCSVSFWGRTVIFVILEGCNVDLFYLSCCTVVLFPF
jgi:hypothetical protein